MYALGVWSGVWGLRTHSFPRQPNHRRQSQPNGRQSKYTIELVIFHQGKVFQILIGFDLMGPW